MKGTKIVLAIFAAFSIFMVLFILYSISVEEGKLSNDETEHSVK